MARLVMERLVWNGQYGMVRLVWSGRQKGKGKRNFNVSMWMLETQI